MPFKPFSLFTHITLISAQRARALCLQAILNGDIFAQHTKRTNFKLANIIVTMVAEAGARATTPPPPRTQLFSISGLGTCGRSQSLDSAVIFLSCTTTTASTDSHKSWQSYFFSPKSRRTGVCRCVSDWSSCMLREYIHATTTTLLGYKLLQISRLSRIFKSPKTLLSALVIPFSHKILLEFSFTPSKTYFST